MFLIVGLASSDPAGGGTATADVIEALSGIDFLPGAATLSAILGGDLTTLVAVANGDGDPGVRVRAYRSLGQFNEPAARQGLKTGIDRYRSEQSGTNSLYLAAAAEGLGQIADPGDVSTLGPLLDAPSRDVRVVAARALGRIGDPASCALLRLRRDVEQVEQVQIEVDEAAATCAP